MKFIDLFSGIGGFRLALEQLNQKCVFSADYNKYSCDSYSMNFDDYPFIDISTLKENLIPDHDILCAGFPCQPFSIAGYRKGFEDVRGTLFFDLLRIIRHKKPQIFILENVKGLVNHDQGNTLNTILNSLGEKINGVENINRFKDNLGYNVFWKVLNSKDFGVPQNRERIFIVGFQNTDIFFEFPSTEKIVKKTLSDILDKEPLIKDISSLSKEYILGHLSSHPKYKEISDLAYLVAYEIRKSKTSFRFDNNSPCLTTKMGTGGNNVPYLVNHNRFFTLSECLKIQGFPSNFKLTHSYSHALRQIGNSVSIPVVKMVAAKAINKVKQA